MTTDIAGRFTIADQTAEYLAIGFIGSAWADSLTPAQLDHVRGFYGMTGRRAEVWPSCPVKLNQNPYNDFLIISRAYPARRENGGNDREEKRN